MTEVKTLLKGIPYFKNQSDTFFDKLTELLKRVELDDGAVLLKEGEHVQQLIVLQEGSLVRTRSNPSSPDADALVIDEITEPHALCLLHLLSEEGDPAYATVTVKGKAVVWQSERKAVQSLVTSDPKFALAFMAGLAEQVRSGSKIMRALAQRTAGEDGGKSFKGLRMLCYDSTTWVRDNFSKGIDAYNEQAADDKKINISYTSDTLSTETAANAAGHDLLCLFVNDTADSGVLKAVSNMGIKMIAMRCAGYDRIDANAAETLGLTVARVPAYSPYAVAEHGITLLMTLNRKLHKAVNRVKDLNFTLDGLVGFDLHGKTVGVIGTGKIGVCLCNILFGFGVKLICYDVHPSDDLKKRGATYVEMDEVWGSSDVVFLMTPLFESTHHLFNKSVLPKLKKGMVLVNTSRGGLIETSALIEGLRSGVLGGAALDVYENEAGYFFKDCSDKVIEDTQLTELLTFHNVILTAHQAFFTQEAIDKIVSTTIENVDAFMGGKTGRDHPNTIFTS